MNNGNNRQWENVAPTSDNQRWEPQKTNPQVDPNNPPFIMGYFSKMKILNGQKGPFNVAEIHLTDANGIPTQKIDVSGGKVLDDRLNEIQLGSYVCIQYLGKVRSKSSGNGYNNWNIMIDKGAVPYSQVMEKLNALPPVANQQSQNTFNPANNTAVPANGAPVFNNTIPPANTAAPANGFPTPPVFNGGGQQQNTASPANGGFFGGGQGNPFQ